MPIFYVNSPSFVVEVERLREPALRRVPLAVAACISPQAPLISVSPEAHALGIRPGLKVAQARSLERHLKIVPADPPLYEKAQEKMLSVAQRFTPLYEAERLGSFFLDMAGTERLFGKSMDAAAKIQAEISRALNLRATIGVAANKLVSRIAANVVRPQGVCDVFPGNESDFLAPLELNYLPVLEDLQASSLFQELAVGRIGDLVGVPLRVLIQIFGKRGEELYHQAHGIDLRPVQLPEEEERISEEVNLDAHTNDDATLLGALWKTVETLGEKLRRRHQVTAQARLEGLHTDLRRLVELIPIHPPSNGDFSLFRALKKAWCHFLKRRIAVKFLRLSFLGLSPEFSQASFEKERPEERLFASLDRLRAKYGRSVVRISR
jgi:DNA polymerase-4